MQPSREKHFLWIVRLFFNWLWLWAVEFAQCLVYVAQLSVLDISAGLRYRLLSVAFVGYYHLSHWRWLFILPTMSAIAADVGYCR
jgi:hypothetical protein